MLTPKEMDVARRYVRNKCGFEPHAAVILGSGIPAPDVDVECEVAFGEVPFLAPASVHGHRGVFVFGRAGDTPVVLAVGRLHLFEGIPADVVTLPVRLFARLGCHVVVVTGAVGSLRDEFALGDVVIIKDHINLSGASPFAGSHHQDLGPRFVVAAEAYDPTLRATAHRAAEALGYAVKEGVYVAVPGPNYETAAEARAYAQLGGDVIGMSVVNEVLVARQEKMSVLGLCAVVNRAGSAEVSHEEVVRNAAAPGAAIARIVTSLLTSHV